MKITSKYTVALQLLMLCEQYKNEKITSGFISKKIGADPVIVRLVMLNLKSANYITNKPGPGGTTLIKDLNEITLNDVYRCVIDDETDEVLKFYKIPDEASPFESTFIKTANEEFLQYINSFYEELKKHTVKELYDKTIKNIQ